MGRRVSFVNDIQILKEMLSPDAQVMLQSRQGRPSVELTDSQSGTTVEIKGLPHNSIVIKADDFDFPLAIFNDIKYIRRRADFVIVSNDDSERKWVICLETKGGNKTRTEIVAQLKGAVCFIRYCKCIVKSFWESDEFLDEYEYRFVSVARLNDPIKRRVKREKTTKSRKKSKKYHLYYPAKLHNRPDVFLKISRVTSIHFKWLINPES